MINHNIVGLDVSVHDSFAVAVIQCLHKMDLDVFPVIMYTMYYLQEFVDIVSNIVIDEFWVKASEVGVIDVFED